MASLWSNPAKSSRRGSLFLSHSVLRLAALLLLLPLFIALFLALSLSFAAFRLCAIMQSGAQIAVNAPSQAAKVPVDIVAVVVVALLLLLLLLLDRLLLLFL